jgi:hypothetical protein
MLWMMTDVSGVRIQWKTDIMSSSDVQAVQSSGEQLG